MNASMNDTHNLGMLSFPIQSTYSLTDHISVEACIRVEGLGKYGTPEDRSSISSPHSTLG